MSKARVAPKPEPEKHMALPLTVPLADVLITVGRPRLFSSDESDEITFDGEQLAVALRWIALTCPNLDHFTEPEYAALGVAGIAEMCRGLGEADLAMSSVDSNTIFSTLHRLLGDLANRVLAQGGALTTPPPPAITINPKAP